MYKNVMRKGAELREAGLLEEDQKVADLFNNDEMIKALAGWYLDPHWLEYVHPLPLYFVSF